MDGLFISGAHVVSPGCDLGVANVRVADGHIVAVGSDARPASGDRIIAADGLTLLPGFVDIHSHGRSGCDFCDATDAAFETIGRDKLQDGVTGFLATGLTRPEDELAEMCRCAERYKRGTGNGERGTGNGEWGTGNGEWLWCDVSGRSSGRTVLQRRNGRGAESRLP